VSADCRSLCREGRAQRRQIQISRRTRESCDHSRTCRPARCSGSPSWPTPAVSVSAVDLLLCTHVGLVVREHEERIAPVERLCTACQRFAFREEPELSQSTTALSSSFSDNTPRAIARCLSSSNCWTVLPKMKMLHSNFFQIRCCSVQGSDGQRAVQRQLHVPVPSSRPASRSVRDIGGRNDAFCQGHE